MIFSETVRLVFINLRQNKFKVLLTSLGIIVGAATIVLVIAIGRGGQADVADQFKNLNAGAIDITYTSAQGSGGFGDMFSGGGGMPSGGGGTMPSGGGGGGGGGMTSGGTMPSMDSGFPGGSMPGLSDILTQNEEAATLTAEDVDDIEIFVPGISSATIYVKTTTAVSGGDLEEDTDYTIAGVKSNYADMSNLTLAAGSFITDEDDENINKSVVLGYQAAIDIFGSVLTAYDNTLYIDGVQYVVNGVLEQMGNVASGISPDSTVFIPYTTAQKYILGADVSPTITAIATEVSEVPEAIENIESLLSSNYPNSTFTITDAGSTMEAATSSANTLSYLLIAVASIVFIVGGIGIMNVMFVSVKERTGEIGVLKALGAGKKDICIEFLIESNMISTLGGLLGVAIGFAAVPLVNMAGMRAVPSVAGAVLALLFAIVTGTVFGIYPAIKASALVPIQALNQE